LNVGSNPGLGGELTNGETIMEIKLIGTALFIILSCALIAKVFGEDAPTLVQRIVGLITCVSFVVIFVSVLRVIWQ
jgi:hypothetical protein